MEQIGSDMIGVNIYILQPSRVFSDIHENPWLMIILKKEKIERKIWLDGKQMRVDSQFSPCPWLRRAWERAAGGATEHAGRERGGAARAPHKGPRDAIDSLGFNPAWGVYR